MSRPLDHKEAWDVANTRYEDSNLARCYVALHYLLREVMRRDVDSLGTELVERIRDAIDPILKAP